MADPRKRSDQEYNDATGVPEGNQDTTREELGWMIEALVSPHL
jgi:hypothetical protein